MLTNINIQFKPSFFFHKRDNVEVEDKLPKRVKQIWETRGITFIATAPHGIAKILQDTVSCS